MTRPRRALAAVIAVTSLLNRQGEGFVPPNNDMRNRAGSQQQQQQRRRSAPGLRESYSGGGGSDEGDDRYGEEASSELEAARMRLERMMGGGQGSGKGGGDESGAAADELPPVRKTASANRKPRVISGSGRRGGLTPRHWEEQLDRGPPPLTSIARERREAEISLLSSLSSDDAALSDLWSLWFSERGPDAAGELLRAEELASRGSDYWDEAEGMLRDIIEEHGVHWAEPVNRLATLLYQRGRLQEARALCEYVLAVKPWHFGALSGIVMVCVGMEDAQAARLWADRRLPPLQPIGDNARRYDWAARASGEAGKSLIGAEFALKKGFQGLDKYEDDVRREPPSSEIKFGFDVDDLEPKDTDDTPGYEHDEVGDAWQ